MDPAQRRNEAPTRLVGIALIAGVATFLGVAWVVTPEGGLTPDLMTPSTVQAVATLAVLLLIGGSLVETRQKRIQSELEGPVDPAAQRVASVLAMALRELAGLVAIMMGMLSGRLGFATALAGVVLLVMVLSLPRRS